MLKSLATEEDISDILDLYRTCFDTSPGDTSVFEQQQPVSYECGGLIETADLGVETESTLSYVELTHNLGFHKGSPLLFNTHRHTGGLTPWDNPTAFENVDQDGFVAISLRWHQLAGVHAVFRRLFSKEPTPEHLGVLIADEVGLGKTLQSLAIVATLTEYVGRQSLAEQPDNIPQTIPPLLRK